MVQLYDIAVSKTRWQQTRIQWAQYNCMTVIVLIVLTQTCTYDYNNRPGRDPARHTNNTLPESTKAYMPSSRDPSEATP